MLIQFPATGMDTFHQTRLLHPISILALNTSRDVIHNSGQYHVGKVVLVWTKQGNGTEQNLLIHLNYVEQNNKTKVFPAFIENHKCGKLNSTGTTSTSSFISEETDLCHRTILIHFSLTVKKNQFSGCRLFLFFVFFFFPPFLEMLLCLSNKL